MRQHRVFLIMLATGLLARFALMPLRGNGDSVVFARWTIELAQTGFAHLEKFPMSPLDNFPAYTFYLPILWFIGKMWTAYLPAVALFGAGGSFVMKLPGVIGDGAIAWLLYRWGLRSDTTVARRVCLLWFLNPAILYVSAYWGQIDSLHTLAIFAAFVAIFLNASFPAIMAMGVAMALKPQSLAFVPIFLLTLWNHFAWKRLVAEIVVATLIVGVGVAFVYQRTPFSEVRQGPAQTFTAYPFLSNSAANIWAPFQARARSLIRDSVVIGGISAKSIGLGIFALAILGILYLGRWGAQDEKSMLLGAVASGMAFFLFPTEMHERYLYPIFPFLAMLAVREPRRYGAWYALLSLAFLGNLLLVQPFLGAWEHTFMPRGPLMYAILAVFLGGFMAVIGRLYFVSRVVRGS